jgi:Phage Terminase
VTEPLDLVASMVLDSGARWGEEAVPDQWADMEALLSPGGPRRHYWLRARGRSKSTDVAAAAVALLLTEHGAGDEAYVGAAGRDQAALVARKVAGLASRTPELSGAIEVQNYRVVAPGTGATLEVISSDLASSWGRTPRFAALDELANWESGESSRMFAESMLSSLPKRRDSRCVIVTTPSSPSHWAHALWLAACDDPLWRTSLTRGPAPWMSPEEIASERRRLPESWWLRLFECRWAEADDAIADAEAVADCVRHDGPLPPVEGARYVVSFDLSTVSDHTAVAVCHLDEGSGRRVVVLDRLRAWKPSRARPLDMAAVEAYIGQAARDYGGAVILGDPYQATSMCQRLREHHQVREVAFSAGANSKRAQMLLRLVRDRDVALPDDPDLRRELLSLRLVQGASPGLMKLATDGSSQGHYDRVTALMLAAEHLLATPGGSWLDGYGLRRCEQCGDAYRRERDACLYCGADNPDAGEEPAGEAAAEDTTLGAAPQPAPVSAWGVARCENGHPYFVDRNGGKCPQCPQGNGPGFLRGSPLAGLGRPGGFR